MIFKQFKGEYELGNIKNKVIRKTCKTYFQLHNIAVISKITDDVPTCAITVKITVSQKAKRENIRKRTQMAKQDDDHEVMLLISGKIFYDFYHKLHFSRTLDVSILFTYLL